MNNIKGVGLKKREIQELTLAYQVEDKEKDWELMERAAGDKTETLPAKEE